MGISRHDSMKRSDSMTPYSRGEARNMSIVAIEFKSETARGFLSKKSTVKPTEGNEDIGFKTERTAQEQYMRQLMAQDENLKDRMKIEEAHN